MWDETTARSQSSPSHFDATWHLPGERNMSILQDILSWAQGLPSWQSDAIARLFAKQTLSQQDMEDLYALLKVEHGIPDVNGRVANKLSAEHIPAALAANSHVELLAMKNLRHVNAMAENQRLAVAAKGLTIIYGDNGSGKSGYSRVLKRACRARDQAEPIHPNANLPAAQAGIAEAVFELSINGVEKDVTWVSGKAAPQELSSLAIFDSRCARAYLDEEDDFAYVPYGLDILEGLGHVCKQLDGLVKTEHSQNAPDTTAFADLGNDGTAVGKLIAGLSAKTKREQVETLATVSVEEIARREDLDKSLKADNPKEKAVQLRLRAARIAKITKNATEMLAIVDSAALTKIRLLAEAYHTAKVAAELAAQVFKEDASVLQGTGGEAWKELFEAARTFCTEAHPGKEFPHLGPEAQCPLCQQPLSNEGADRLIRFDKFIQDEAEKNAKARKKALADEYKTFVGKSISLGFDDELFAEIEALDKELAPAVRAFEKALADRHVAIKEACVSHEWEEITPEPPSPASQLQALVDKLTQGAADLEKAADEKARAAMQAEFEQLDARLKLSKVKAGVLAAIGKHDLQTKLTKCLSAVKTNAISMKATELAEKVISKELADALNSEFKTLGAGNLSISLQSRSAKGKPLHKLKLELSQAKNPGDILSEGEQRAIAIGAFLAEVNIGGGTGGIVFDDPVSSLDHKRRERVAIRLVQEAGKRQVIIFTHDVYFLCVLMEEATRAGVACATQSLSRKPEGYGIADPSLPFEGMGTKARIGALRNMQQQIAKLYKDGDESEHRKKTVDAYYKLRITWERAVEEILFRNVVIRFRKGISTQLLAGVVVDDADYACIDSAMTKCSNYPHDQALLGGTAIPDPDELLADINTLDDWRNQVVKRSEEVRKKRTSAAATAA
jgi:energy-coupling factor transporter ATP-binding protein EcfA2